MDCTEGAVAVFDLCNDEELVALTHGVLTQLDLCTCNGNLKIEGKEKVSRKKG